MSILNAARIVFLVLLAAWGATSMLGLLYRHEVPLMRRARLLSGLCGVLLALALLGLGAGWLWPSVAVGLVGIGCGAAWLYILFKQSLNNTTM